MKPSPLSLRTCNSSELESELAPGVKRRYSSIRLGHVMLTWVLTARLTVYHVVSMVFTLQESYLAKQGLKQAQHCLMFIKSQTVLYVDSCWDFCLFLNFVDFYLLERQSTRGRSVGQLTAQMTTTVRSVSSETKSQELQPGLPRG